MKIKSSKYLFFVLVFIAYIASSNYIFTVLTQVSDESSRVKIDLPEPSSNINLNSESNRKNRSEE